MKQVDEIQIAEAGGIPGRRGRSHNGQRISEQLSGATESMRNQPAQEQGVRIIIRLV